MNPIGVDSEVEFRGSKRASEVGAMISGEDTEDVGHAYAEIVDYESFPLQVDFYSKPGGWNVGERQNHAQ